MFQVAWSDLFVVHTAKKDLWVEKVANDVVFLLNGSFCMTSSQS